MNYKLKVKCIARFKEYFYHLNINGFKSINNNTATVIVVKGTQPLSTCPYCDAVNYLKYTNSLSAPASYIEVPRLIKEEETYD